MTRRQRVAVASAWILAVAGALLATVLCFAADMKSVPGFKGAEGLPALTLALLAIFLGTWVLTARRRIRAPQHLAWIGPPVALAALSLLLVFASYIQPR